MENHDFNFGRFCRHCACASDSFPKDAACPEAPDESSGGISVGEAMPREVGCTAASALVPARDIVHFTFKTEDASMSCIVDGDTDVSLGQYLLLGDLPYFYLNHYGSIPEKIFVRPCYVQLYELASANMFELLNSGRALRARLATLFTGIPGVGKSMFLLYFLYRFLDDNRFPDKRFALQFRGNEYHYFEPIDAMKGLFRRTVETTTDRKMDFLLLCDVHALVEPIGRAMWTFIFSSPNPVRYKDILKDGPNARYTMPTWDECEMMFLEPDRTKWQSSFDLLGGIPRYTIIPSTISIYSNPRGMFAEYYLMFGSHIGKGMIQKGLGILDASKKESYFFVHINPPKLGNGSYDFEGKVKYSFASPAVCQMLMPLDSDPIWKECADSFNRGYHVLSSNTLARHYLERLCLHVMKLNGRRLHATCLSSALPEEVFQVPPTSQRQVLNHDWRTAQTCQLGVFYVPEVSNMESGDAFYAVHGDAESIVLVVLQVAVGNYHPVKANGLKTIVEAYGALSAQITRKVLLFVTPKCRNDGGADIDGVQHLHTQRDSVMEVDRVPAAVRGFEQYVHRHMVHNMQTIELPVRPR